MKSILCTIIVCVFFSMVSGQAVDCNGETRDLKWWRDKGKLAEFPAHRDNLYFLIDNLNTGCVKPLKDDFDKYRRNNNPKSIDCGPFVQRMRANIQDIKAASFYTAAQLCESPFLYYYSNKEMNDYLNSIEALRVETEHLIPASQTMNVFKNNSFLSAYFNFTQSRALLLAAIGDLDRFYMLGNVMDSTSAKASRIDTGVDEVKTTTGITYTLVDSVKQNSQQIVKDLESEFLPALPLKSAKNNALIKSNPGKVNTAANTILVDNRKNGWWRGIVGGLIGGMVAGVIIAAAN